MFRQGLARDEVDPVKERVEAESGSESGLGRDPAWALVSGSEWELGLETVLRPEESVLG